MPVSPFSSGSLDILLQLSVTINIVSIAAFRVGQIGSALEHIILQTEKRIEERLGKCMREIKSGIQSIESMAIGSVDSDTDKHTAKRVLCESTKNKYSTTRDLLQGEEVRKLVESLNKYYAPKFMAYLCVYCSIYAMLALACKMYVSNYPSTQYIFHYFTLLTLIGFCVFVVYKAFIDRHLFCKIKKLRKVAEMEKAQKQLERKHKFENRVNFKILGITYLLIVTGSLSATYIAPMWFKSSSWRLDIFLEYLSVVVVAFSSIPLYVVVTYLYRGRGSERIDKLFIPVEETLEICKGNRKTIETEFGVQGAIDVQIKAPTNPK